MARLVLRAWCLWPVPQQVKQVKCALAQSLGAEQGYHYYCADHGCLSAARLSWRGVILLHGETPGTMAVRGARSGL